MRFGLVLGVCWSLGAAAQAPSSEPAPEPEYEMIPVVLHKVLEVSEGRVTFGAGRDLGFAPGKHVRIVRKLEAPDPNNPDATHELLAVVRIERAESDHSVAHLGRGETARPGDLVDITVEPLTASVAVPRRADYSYRVGVSLRPFLGGENGFAMLLGGFVSYRPPKVPYFALNASLDPLSVGLGIPLGARLSATAALSMSYFELGVGLGAVPNSPYFCTGCSPVVVTFVTTARAGALDGANLQLNVGTALLGYLGVAPVSLTVEANAALTREIALFGHLAANLWDQGAWAGVRLLTQGSGERGSILYSLSAGYTFLALGNFTTAAGLSLSLGAEFRL